MRAPQVAGRSSRGLSIRARLTLWYTLAFGLLIAAAGLATYTAFARVIEHDSESYLTDAADAVAASLQLELLSRPVAHASDIDLARRAAIRTVENHRYRDLGLAIFHPTQDGQGKLTLSLLAVDTVSTATRLFGGNAGWRRASVSAVRSLASMETDIVTMAEYRERVVSMPITTRRGVFVVAVSESILGTERILARIRQIMIIGLPLLLSIGACGGYLLAAASLRPVDAMRAQAARITASNLYERLPVSRPTDELARLSETFNALLDRVEGAFAQRRQFTADASHELRTPVAIVIGESELALAAERSPDAYRAALQVILGEGRRLARIVADLFLLARSDAAEQIVNVQRVYLEELVSDCVDAMGSLARSKNLQLEFSPVSEVPVQADDALLRRAVMNLLDNAIKYTPLDGTVRVETESTADGGGIVRVADSGPGIPEEHRARIFERFFRVQHTTSRGGLGDASGAGLGLPIAAWIAEIHGGALRLGANDGAGAVFELALPGASPR